MDFTLDRKNPIRVFCSYAHQDERLQKELLKHLSTLEKDEVIVIQDDREHETNTHINTAQIILLLVSADFLDNSTEIGQALRRHEEKTARVIPIILRPVNWESRLAHLKPLPTNTKPISRWGNKDEAFLDVAMGIREAAIDIWLRRGSTCRIEGNFPLALYAYKQAIVHSDPKDDNSKITAYTNIGHILYADHKHTQALEAYEQAIEYGSQDTSVYTNLTNIGYSLYADHKHTQALKAYERVIEHGSQDASVYTNKGHILYADHKHTQALKAYEQAIEYGSQDTSVYTNLTNIGHVLYAAKEYGQALKAYERVIEYGSGDASVYTNKGRMLSNLKQYKEALEGLKFAIYLDSRNASAYYSKGDIHYTLQQYKEALTAYEQAARFDYGSKGNLLNDFKFYKEVFAAYWRTIQCDVGENYVYHGKNGILHKTIFNLIILIKSFTIYLLTILFFYNNAYYCNIRGCALLGLKYYKGALVAFDLATQIDSGNAIYHDNKGIALQMLEDYQEALIAHIRATQLLPEDAQAWYHKRKALVGLQRMEEAEQAYERAKQLGYNEYIDDINMASEEIP
ncbi:MAG TPA: tetratricopeptide repeat protein [Ktedonobacteraceae bacterium]